MLFNFYSHRNNFEADYIVKEDIQVAVVYLDNFEVVVDYCLGTAFDNFEYIQEDALAELEQKHLDLEHQ